MNGKELSDIIKQQNDLRSLHRATLERVANNLLAAINEEQRQNGNYYSTIVIDKDKLPELNDGYLNFTLKVKTAEIVLSVKLLPENFVIVRAFDREKIIYHTKDAIGFIYEAIADTEKALTNLVRADLTRCLMDLL